MSDLGRKDISDKVSESLTPDSEKSTLEKGKESVTDALDNAANKAVPDSQKSFSQTVADKFSEGKKDAQGEGQTLAETAQEYVEAAKEKLSEAAEYVSQTVGGATEGAQKGAEGAKK
ncbi:HSP12 [Candida oxycetoniae]|uniref:HSP12 n=1 Tax=Candida oxycetoniae TaxID=497107 RepID=A0AAI9SW26_9ASCO|nr:HSP12 [Candida oxycetoniae]KAI3404151.1 HSP12 [Candida oxycetoniae]